MKFKVEDINDLSDSREVMESKPSSAIKIFVYIVIGLIFTTFIWMWFSEKEIIVKINGIVKPYNESYIISNLISGRVKRSSMTNGENVKKDDVLFTIDDSDLQMQKKYLDEQNSQIETDNTNLEKLKKSIVDGKNYFVDDGSEKEYFYKYKNYESGDKSSLADKENIAISKDHINEEISKLQILLKSINEDKNYNEDGTTYSEQFNNYKLGRKNIENKSTQLEDSKKDLLDKKNKLNPENVSDKNDIERIDKELKQIDAEIEDTKVSLDKLVSDTKIQVNSEIDKLKEQLTDVNSNIKKIEDNIEISKYKDKSSILAQAEEKVKVNKSKEEELKLKLDNITKKIQQCTVKAQYDGKLDIKNNIEPGTMIQEGIIIASILPNDNKYKVELLINDKDIANLKIGDKVKYSFPSLPYEEYGFINGYIKNISANSQVDSKTGLVYFNGQGELENKVLYSNKKEPVGIKSGMTCEVRVVSRKEKMLYYILEKLKLKTSK